MKIKLTKHIFGDLIIEKHRLVGCYGPSHISGNGLSDNEIAQILKNPIDMKPVSTLAVGCKRVLMVTDDNTRATPLKRLLPPILEELEPAGVSKDKVSFLIALGPTDQ